MKVYLGIWDVERETTITVYATREAAVQEGVTWAVEFFEGYQDPPTAEEVRDELESEASFFSIDDSDAWFSIEEHEVQQ